ncbi:cytochrome c-type biogenesis protein [Rheinheimera sp. 4Y26]|uniref:cytochrome c-type biogenesis protein n=1 Tax=Rheinheimera sp. 4Y26 TaxID=2977811 RepID=UPI0021B0A1F7|nr:cytochrome c-type biogenesis protein [Rheinheimera sp. 4Y26]MCT6699569.1 cytochrome c-type biogenesis protein CcmH [Rheinheimera sp. 4Y26]
MRPKMQLFSRAFARLLLALCLCPAFATTAAEELLPFKDAQQQALYRELTAELRCPKCQNQNIADSNAVVAVDMREKTYQLVQQGQNKEQVIDYMKQRYGDFVHYQPPVQWSTIWLWLAPLLLLAGLFWVMLQKQQKVQQLQQTDAVDPELEQKLQAMIEQAMAEKSSKEPD